MSEAHYLDVIADADTESTFGDQVGQHIILGSTIDDSIGEAFDKTVLLSVHIFRIYLPCWLQQRQILLQGKGAWNHTGPGLIKFVDGIFKKNWRKDAFSLHFLSSLDMVLSRDGRLKGTRLERIRSM